MYKNLIYSLLIILVFGNLTLAQGTRVSHIDETYVTAFALNKGSNPPVPISLQNITDTLSDNVVGHYTIHQVGFQLPYFDSQPVGLLRGRQIVVTFPPEFDISTVQDVVYSDTDEEADDPGIEEIVIYAHSVVVSFKDKIPGPENPHYAYLEIHSVKNPTLAANYRVTVYIDNLLGQTIAGPGYSHPFAVIPDEAQSLEISPVGDTILTAGEGIDFEATAVDQYGNPIPTDRVVWSVDSELDPIGRMYGSFFQATTAGEGRVRAAVDGLEAYSGLITVIPGEFAALEIELDETQFIGHLFMGVANVLAQDEYGNLVTDFDETGIELYLSTSLGIVSPEILHADLFVGGIASLNSHMYDGQPGTVTLTISDGGNITTSADFYANGVYIAFKEAYYLPEWLLTQWEFYARGLLWNPADLEPISLTARAEFVGAEAPEPRIRYVRNCMPLPFNQQECQIDISQMAGVTPGAYEYIITVEAIYEFGPDTITAVWTYSKEIPVDEFTPFTYELTDIPSIAFADDHPDTAAVRLFNVNVYDRQISLAPGLFVRNDTFETLIGSESFLFDWESEKEFDLIMHFWAGIPHGIYNYVIKTKGIFYPEDRLWRITYTGEHGTESQVEIVQPPTKAIRIIDVVNNAVNSPYVNTSQEFTIIAIISNYAFDDLQGPFEFELITDGGSEMPPPVTLDIIPSDPFDTGLFIYFPVTAASTPRAAEILTVNIIRAPEDVQILPPRDISAPAIIQTPARVSLTANIVGQPGHTAVFAFGQIFEIDAGMENTGEAQVDGGTVVLSYEGPGDFGLAFPSEQSFESFVPWSLSAPNENIISSFEVALGDFPLDRNTGEPAIIEDSVKILNFEVRQAEARLIIQADGFSNQPLERGVPGKLFELTLQNSTSDSRNTLAVNRLTIDLLDRYGRPIDARTIIDETPGIGTNFYIDGEPVGVRDVNSENLTYTFPNLIIRASQIITIEYWMMPKSDASLDFFNMRLTGDMIEAAIIEGPQAGQMVPVTGLLDRAFVINVPQAIIPEEFAASFKNYPNPFNPLIQPTEIRYNLPSDADVDIFIYTATGEEVRHLHFSAGANGGQAGLNAGIFWDGRNGNGDMVLNGVYVAYIEVGGSSLTATVKMAVVK